MNRIFLLCISVLGIASCTKPTSKPQPCGDPYVAEAPAMRIMDKQSGKDYFINNSQYIGKLQISSSCGRIVPETIQFNPLTNKSNVKDGYILSYNYLPLPMGKETGQCKTYIWTINSTDNDTVQYFTHTEEKECYSLAVLDSIYYNGGKAAPVPDTNDNTRIWYYSAAK